MKKTFSTRTITYIAFFIAINIILVRFLTIKPIPTLRFDFGFFPIFLSSTLFGPILGGITAGIADILGMLVNSNGTAYIPLMTVNTIISGLIYGLFFYKKSECGTKRISLVTIILAVATQIILVEVILQALAMYYYMFSQSKSIFVILTSRYIKALVMFPIQVISIKYSFDYLIPLIFPKSK